MTFSVTKIHIKIKIKNSYFSWEFAFQILEQHLLSPLKFHDFTQTLSTFVGLVTSHCRVLIFRNLSSLSTHGHKHFWKYSVINYFWILSKIMYSYKLSFLGIFAKLQKATIGFVMSVCPFVCPSVRIEQLGSHWRGFLQIWILFENPSRKSKFP
jgi:hypothetical protein